MSEHRAAPQELPWLLCPHCLHRWDAHLFKPDAWASCPRCHGSFSFTKPRQIAVPQEGETPGAPEHVCGLQGYQRGREYDPPCPACVYWRENVRPEQAQPRKLDAAPQTWWCCSADYPNHEPNCPNAAPQEGETRLTCMDCSTLYADFGLDTTLPDEQWRMIHSSDGGVLCASCIVKRAAKLLGAVALRARIAFAPDPSESGARPEAEVARPDMSDQKEQAALLLRLRHELQHDCRSELERRHPLAMRSLVRDAEAAFVSLLDQVQALQAAMFDADERDALIHRAESAEQQATTLRAKVAGLEQALQEIADSIPERYPMPTDAYVQMLHVARAALDEKASE